MKSYVKVTFLAVALAFMAAPPAHATYCFFYCSDPAGCGAAVAPACASACFDASYGCEGCGCNPDAAGTACECS